MKFASVCSGIEAASIAWHPLGWRASFLSEIEPFPCALLAHHYASVPNLGDMTRFEEWPDANPDVLVGGTPCQSFSVAGLRKGLADPRGNLMLTYGAIARKYRPRWLVWENVPGVLSSAGGRDFGTFLGMLGELGYGFAYRVLDAQFFGVAQRRRRVFVVGCLGAWQRAAAVLFECASLRGDPAPRRETRQTTPTIPSRSTAGGGLGTDFDCDGGLIARTLLGKANSSHAADVDGYVVGSLCADAHPGAYSGQDAYSGRLIAHSLRADGVQSLLTRHKSRIQTIVSNPRDGDPCHSLSAQAHAPHIAYKWAASAQQSMSVDDVAPALRAARNGEPATGVRRLTPRECERLQGFPDDYTLIPYRGKPAADGPRYKALGNSMAVPVMRWIGERIVAVEAIA